MLDRLNLIDILYSLPAIFLAFSFHEFAHAFVAYQMGDSTPKLQGRLTLDPLSHVNWIGLIMFVYLGLVGQSLYRLTLPILEIVSGGIFWYP